MSPAPHRAGVFRRTTILAVVAMFTVTIFAAAVPAGSAPRASSRIIARDRVAREQRTVDARTTGSAVGVSARTAAARSSLARSMGTMGVIQSDRTTGTLRFVGRLDGYLTSKSTRSASSVALRYVRTNRVAFGLRGPDLRSFRLQRDYVDISGTHHLSWVQRAGGLTVFGQGLHAAVAADGRLVNVTGGPVRGVRAPVGASRLNAGAAIAAARAGAQASGTSDDRDSAELALFPTGRGVRLAWKTVTYVSPSETDLSLVDADTGEVLYRNNMTDTGVPPTETDSTGDDIWPFYFSSIPPNGGGTPAANVDIGSVYDTFQNFFGLPGTYPDTQLFGNNAWVFKDVNDDSFPDPGDAFTPTGGTAGGTFEFDFLDRRVRQRHARESELQSRACLHLGLQGEEELEGAAQAQRRAGVLPPQQVP